MVLQFQHDISTGYVFNIYPQHELDVAKHSIQHVGVSKVMGMPPNHPIQVMDDHDLVLNATVIWGFPILRTPPIPIYGMIVSR